MMAFNDFLKANFDNGRRSVSYPLPHYDCGDGEGCVCVFMHACVYVCVLECVCVCVWCASVCVCVCKCVCICVCVSVCVPL